jgi:hypothetical protein
MSNPFAFDAPATAPATAPVAQATAPAAASVTTDLRSATGATEPDPFDAPAPQMARGPRLREMYGRLVLIIPRKIETGLVSSRFKNPDGSPVVNDRMTADVVILDGGTIAYGGRPEAVPPVPHDKTAETPHKTAAMFISSAGLISQCREALAKIVSQGRPGMVLGRLTKGEGGQGGEPPWILTPATDADKAIGRTYLATVDPFA